VTDDSRRPVADLLHGPARRRCYTTSTDSTLARVTPALEHDEDAAIYRAAAFTLTRRVPDAQEIAD
jgi:hypothetical protein